MPRLSTVASAMWCLAAMVGTVQHGNMVAFGSLFFWPSQSKITFYKALDSCGCWGGLSTCELRLRSAAKWSELRFHLPRQSRPDANGASRQACCHPYRNNFPGAMSGARSLEPGQRKEGCALMSLHRLSPHHVLRGVKALCSKNVLLLCIQWMPTHRRWLKVTIGLQKARKGRAKIGTRCSKPTLALPLR